MCTTIKYRLAALSVAVLLAGCGGGGNNRRADSGSASPADATGAAVSQASHRGPRLMVPQPPALLSNDSARLDFVSAHYWDNFDYADSGWIADTTALGGTFTPWAQVLAQLPPDRAAALAGELIRRGEAAPAMQLRLAEVAEYFWDHPNSPFRSEELYIPVLEAVIAALGIDDVDKIRPRAQLAAALKNRPGTIAADFNYTTPSGRTGRLSKLRGDHTLLLFYTPGCPDCARVEQYIADSEILAPLIASHRMTMLAVYVDEDLGTWREHLPQMPRGWTVVCDPAQAINNLELYALPAIPNLYLLDKDKRVILKDAPVERIEAWLAASQKQETY